MPFASGSGLRVAYVAETDFGTTPATPAFTMLRTTSGGLRTNKTTDTSKEIQPDRNIRDMMLNGLDVTGSYPIELSYGTFDDIMAAALFGAWNVDVLKNGTTRQSLTFEETLTIGAAESYSRFTGCMVNQFSLDIQARQTVTGSVDLMGQKETLDSAAVVGATYADADTEPVSTASANVAALTVADLAPQPKIRRVQFQVANNLRTRPVVGDLYSEAFGEGMCEVTGTIEAYFASNALYQKVLDHGSGALSFTVGNAANKKYTFLFPKIIFGDGQVQKGGQTDDVIVSIPVQAVYDATEQASVKISRAVA
ncbi:MAG: phage tail tube protein [Pararhizobium sp.]